MNNGDYSDERNNCELGGAIFPKSASDPLGGCNSDRAQYSNTPSLRMPGVEEDDDENEAHHELARNTENAPLTCLSCLRASYLPADRLDFSWAISDKSADVWLTWRKELLRWI
jgi:hypothetical protein